jgi:hypothetical protein
MVGFQKVPYLRLVSQSMLIHYPVSSDSSVGGTCEIKNKQGLLAQHNITSTSDVLNSSLFPPESGPAVSSLNVLKEIILRLALRLSMNILHTFVSLVILLVIHRIIVKKILPTELLVRR